MKKKLLNPALLCMAFVICLAVYADLTGQWKGTVSTPDGNQFPITYTFKTEGDKLTGTLSSQQGDIAITDGKVSGSDFTFTVPFGGTNVPHKGKYYGDSIGIDIDLNGYKMHSTFKRVTQ